MSGSQKRYKYVHAWNVGFCLQDIIHLFPSSRPWYVRRSRHYLPPDCPGHRKGCQLWAWSQESKFTDVWYNCSINCMFILFFFASRFLTLLIKRKYLAQFSKDRREPYSCTCVRQDIGRQIMPHVRPNDQERKSWNFLFLAGTVSHVSFAKVMDGRLAFILRPRKKIFTPMGAS